MFPISQGFTLGWVPSARQADEPGVGVVRAVRFPRVSRWEGHLRAVGPKRIKAKPPDTRWRRRPDG